MNFSWKQYGRQVISGDQRGMAAGLVRSSLAIVEPFYAAAMRGRNVLYHHSILRVHQLPRPVVSVGNITTGGTGKTPVVRWLTEHLVDRGLQPAILLRGYGAQAGAAGDEQLMLDHLLNDAGRRAIPIHALPNRLIAAQAALREDAEIDVFILDDGFQHRRVRRDFDLVLIDASNPFGYGHVLPRGLMREPISGLSRADAIVITHADAVAKEKLDQLERQIRRYHFSAILYRANHVLAGLRASPASESDGSLDDLRKRRLFAFCGIGNPQGFQAQLQSIGGKIAGYQWFVDHHDYSEKDIIDLKHKALAGGAEMMVTTEKDWVKIRNFPAAVNSEPPIARVGLRIEFWNDDETRLLEQIHRKIVFRS